MGGSVAFLAVAIQTGEQTEIAGALSLTGAGPDLRVESLTVFAGEIYKYSNTISDTENG